jgi:Glycosyl hydrolase family 99
MKKLLPVIFFCAILVAGLHATTIARPVSRSPQDVQPSLPLRAAFYYPWFPEAWQQQGIYPFTYYTPTLGYYNSSDPAVIGQHIAAMQYGGIEAGIVSWWGPGSRTDSRLPTILAATAGSSFRWSIYYEDEGQGDPSVSALTADLTYLRDRYGSDPSYLRINGRLVVFVYADSADGCAMVERWKQANTVNAYLVLKVFAGYRACASQPDGWHQYAPALPASAQENFSYTISPSFNKVGGDFCLGRDLARWRRNIRDMIASGATFQLITTFNEWGEGTAVESAQEWASASGYGAFLDALHADGLGSLPPSPTPGEFNWRLFLPALQQSPNGVCPPSIPSSAP